jgi:hypothetical protein
MLIPPAATACHEWAGVPGTQVAVPNPEFGTTQLTSPTSVDPPASERANGFTRSASAISRLSP